MEVGNLWPVFMDEDGDGCEENYCWDGIRRMPLFFSLYYLFILLCKRYSREVMRSQRDHSSLSPIFLFSHAKGDGELKTSFFSLPFSYSLIQKIIGS